MKLPSTLTPAVIRDAAMEIDSLMIQLLQLAENPGKVRTSRPGDGAIAAMEGIDLEAIRAFLRGAGL